mmetsp:Transcript_32372/g.59127  ORF Transcript_32372/g.59127 Transcript_32372/m.59127 type:complete len:275 (-) Transcript_32372:5-829(-)
MGGVSSVSEDTRVTKAQAMAAVSQAFEGKSASSKLSVKDIALAVPIANDTFTTMNHKMHEWHTSMRPSTGGYPVAKVGGRPGGRVSVTPTMPAAGQLPRTSRPTGAIDWRKALESGRMSKSDRMGKIRNMFNAMDKDDSKVVERDEFVSFLVDDGVDPREAQALFASMDDSRTGRLTIAKFDHHVAMTTLEILKDAFKELDASKDRQIQKKEFKAYFMEKNGLSQEQTSHLWTSMDKDKNGKISFMEFRDWAQETLIGESLDRVAERIGLEDSD